MLMVFRRSKGRTITFFAVVLSLVTCILVSVISKIPTTYADTTSVSLFSSGKSSLTIEVDADRLSDSVKDEDAFKEYFQSYVDLINNRSGDNDFVIPEKYEKTNNRYKVTISTRRIDKLIGIGELVYSKGDNLLPDTSESLQKYARGTVKERIRRVYPGDNENEKLYYIGYSDYSKEQEIAIFPKSANTGEKVQVQDFMSALSDGGNKLVVFKMVDLCFIDKITVTLSGTIKYVSSEGVKLLDKNTIEITPMPVRANLDGTNGDEVQVNAMLGYVVYDEGMTPLALGIILICVIWLTAFIIYLGVIGKLNGLFHAKVKKATAQESGKPRLKGRRFKSNLMNKIFKYKMLYAMLLPGLALLIIFHYVPYFGLSAAFQDYSLTEGVNSEWVGMKYFTRIFYANTDRIYQVFRNSIFISLIRIATNFPMILFFALFVHSIKNTRVKSIVQTVSFIPYFLSWTACAGFLYAIISDYGILNTIMAKFGFEAVSWYGKADAWWGILATSSLWKGMGWGTLIYIAAMCNIDSELYEASALDGCSSFRQMFVVTIPGIMPMICLQLILDCSSLMKDNYEQILALINGATGLKDTTEVIGQMSYDALRNSVGYGSATAFGLIQGVIGLILVFVSNRIVKKTDNEGII